MADRSEATGLKSVRDVAAGAIGRLAPLRWLLATCFAGLVVVGVAGDAPIWIMAASAAAALAVAMLSPGGFSRERQVAGDDGVSAGMAGLTAEDLGSAVADPLFVFDRQGAVLFANQPAIDAFGKTPPFSSIEMKFRAPEMQDLLRRALAGEAPLRAIDYAERVPLERWYRVTVTRIDRGNGSFALFFRDQSELRRIDRMRADFIANASHELRTPLASVAGFIETLRGPARSDEKARDHFLQIMQAQTSRMARLIDDLLSLSRLETRAYLRPGETVDLVDVVRSVIDALAHLARDSGVTVETALLPAPVEVAGNRDELIQVFENLLENACKYGQSGGRVVVEMQRGGASGSDEIAVTVRDFGPGIPEEHIPRVTERFYRVDVENSRAQKGTGLGLAIVKHILTRHNARLTIRSGEGKGAAFTVHLPVASAADRAKERHLAS